MGHLPAIKHGHGQLRLCPGLHLDHRPRIDNVNRAVRLWRFHVALLGRWRRSLARNRAGPLGGRRRCPLRLRQRPGDDPPRRLVLLLGQWAHIVVRPRAQVHQALRLEYRILARRLLPHVADGAGGRRRDAGLGSAAGTAAGARLPLHLLLRRQELLWREGRGRGARVDEVGELIALFGEVVLDVARGLVSVEPALAVVIPLPTRWEASHGAWCSRIYNSINYFFLRRLGSSYVRGGGSLAGGQIGIRLVVSCLVVDPAVSDWGRDELATQLKRNGRKKREEKCPGTPLAQPSYTHPPLLQQKGRHCRSRSYSGLYTTSTAGSGGLDREGSDRVLRVRVRRLWERAGQEETVRIAKADRDGQAGGGKEGRNGRVDQATDY